MSNQTVYVKCDRNVEVQRAEVQMTDVGKVQCADKLVNAKLNALKVYQFPKDGSKRCVISVLKLVELMEKECPGIEVVPLGEPDVLVEWVSVDRRKGTAVWLKAAFVCLVSFFGTAFTIMAYHNDVGINEVFGQLYRLVMNREPQGINVLEISYSVGLFLGIVVFFNHVGGRRLTSDPTPIEVAMRKYEEDVDKTLIAEAGREGREQEPGKQ